MIVLLAIGLMFAGCVVVAGLFVGLCSIAKAKHDSIDDDGSDGNYGHPDKDDGTDW